MSYHYNDVPPHETAIVMGKLIEMLYVVSAFSPDLLPFDFHNQNWKQFELEISQVKPTGDKSEYLFRRKNHWKNGIERDISNI